MNYIKLCVDLYKEVTKNPVEVRMREYAKRFSRLSMVDQGEVTYFINLYFTDLKHKGNALAS